MIEMISSRQQLLYL